MRNLAKSLILVLLAFVLCSCTASIPTQRDVNEHIAGIPELEPHDLVRIEQTGKDDNGRVTQEVYTFVTKRGFEFAVKASIHGNYIDGSKFGESSYVSDIYVDAVHELYLPRIRAVLPEYDTEYNVAHDFGAEQIISQVLACDEIYREELSVHSAEWLSTFPVETIFFKDYPDYSD